MVGVSLGQFYVDSVSPVVSAPFLFSLISLVAVFHSAPKLDLKKFFSIYQCFKLIALYFLFLTYAESIDFGCSNLLLLFIQKSFGGNV